MTEQVDERPSEDAPKKPSFREELKTQWRGFTRAKKIGVVAVTSVGLLVMMSMCAAPDSKKKDETAASTSTSIAAAPASETAKAAEPETPKPPRDAVVDTSLPGQVTLTFPIQDSFTKGLIKFSAQRATIELLQWAHQNYPEAEVRVQGTFPMKDQYGNVSTDTILNVTYSSETLNKINFDNVDTDKIWDLKDFGFVHSELRN